MIPFPSGSIAIHIKEGEYIKIEGYHIEAHADALQEMIKYLLSLGDFNQGYWVWEVNLTPDNEFFFAGTMLPDFHNRK